MGLYGPIHTSHAVLPHMIKQNGGRIIMFAGDSSRIGENGLALTAASRAGALALAKSLAREVGRSNITVNAISLGLVETPHDKVWLDENREKLIRFYPMRRLGQTDRCGADRRVSRIGARLVDHRTGGERQRRLRDALRRAAQGEGER